MVGRAGTVSVGRWSNTVEEGSVGAECMRRRAILELLCGTQLDRLALGLAEVSARPTHRISAKFAPGQKRPSP